VRVPDEIASCVAFLCVEDQGVIKFGGTAFYVGVGTEGAGHGWGYLVTARHNVRAAESYPRLGLRVNLKGGGTRLFNLPNSWMYHDNEGSDAAVLRFSIPQDVEIYPVSNSLFVTPQLLSERNIGFGDDIIVPGLFRRHTGQMRNAVIVWSGVIAAMPDEPLQDERTGFDYPVYLVEMRSFGGLSGSPVFVRLDPDRVYGGVPGRYRLLGALRGHWDYEGPLQFPGDESRAFNLGVAIVTPLADVLDILFSDDEVRWRRQQDQEFHAQQKNPPPASSEP
jgi:hypothetical protein